MSRKHCISDSRISQRGITIKPTVNQKPIPEEEEVLSQRAQTSVDAGPEVYAIERWYRDAGASDEQPREFCFRTRAIAARQGAGQNLGGGGVGGAERTKDVLP